MKKILAKNNCTKKIKVQYKRNKNKYKELQINFQAFFLPEMEVAWNYIDVGASNSYKWLQKVFILLNA